MEEYLRQLLRDIASAIEQVPQPSWYDTQDIANRVPPDEERATAPWKSLEEWSGIKKDHLPPEEMLSDEQVRLLYPALEKMLNEYNCSIVFQLQVPERLKYKVLQAHFDQEVPMLRIHMGFFELCRPETSFDQCLLGDYCECRFFAELQSGFVDEDLTPEEERRRMFDIEVSHLRRKYGDDWTRYYPTWLDSDYDDEEEDEDFGYAEDDDDDDWWRQ